MRRSRVLRPELLEMAGHVHCEENLRDCRESIGGWMRAVGCAAVGLPRRTR